MLSLPWIAALIAIFSWWFFTGIILLIVRRKDVAGATAHGASVVWGVPLLALGIFGAVISAASLSVANIYLAFFSVLLIWGWIELAFLSGVITGPMRDSCPKSLRGWARFRRAWQTVSHHEALLLSGLVLMAVIALDAANPLGFWAYFILFAARISAKLNLFFGVPRINLEFIPQPLLHLTSYFKQGPVTLAFGLGLTGLSLVTAALGIALFTASTVEAQIGHALLFALCALATLEHWLMVIPLPDAKLWRWMLPTLSTNTKTRQSHEL